MHGSPHFPSGQLLSLNTVDFVLVIILFLVTDSPVYIFLKCMRSLCDFHYIVHYGPVQNKEGEDPKDVCASHYINMNPTNLFSFNLIPIIQSAIGSFLIREYIFNTLYFFFRFLFLLLQLYHLLIIVINVTLSRLL